MLSESGVAANVVAGRLGVARSTISHYRHARRPIDLETFEAIAEACGYTVKLSITPTRGYDNLCRAIETLRPASTETGLSTYQCDALDRPWVRTEEGWAPTRGNPLRVRLGWDELQRLYGPTQQVRPKINL